jgi:hypothetical protein
LIERVAQSRREEEEEEKDSEPNKRELIFDYYFSFQTT